MFKKIFLIFILFVSFTGLSHAQKARLTVNQDERIPELLGLKKSLEKDNKLGGGYTVQLYYGELNKADEIIRKYRNKYPSWPASIEYETPNYKVWVGNFGNRLDADRALYEIKDDFPAAFILKRERRKKKKEDQQEEDSN
jgi:hypothetical protein